VLSQQAQRLLNQLYRALLDPLGKRLEGWRCLVIVPSGALHYIPFHLLHGGSDYLIERYEITILPAAAYTTRPAVARGGGARVLAYAATERLPYVDAEGRMVRALLGGELRRGGRATRAALHRPPMQVLHIAAHGEHRLDAPDLSYIELADGQLYTDDLLQEDLSYELVTLSACETGQALVAPGDELIGLGRGFLYAGAGALITSLWPVADVAAPVVMRHLYRELLAGASKAAALQTAQLALRAANPTAHPAFWGAFQLVGNARPLSTAYAEFTAGMSSGHHRESREV
jgi:CHAT domain-containing protein